jgi:carboxypeptidase C (cathepsin A)
LQGNTVTILRVNALIAATSILFLDPVGVGFAVALWRTGNDKHVRQFNGLVDPAT